MSEGLSKSLSIVLYVLLGISAVLGILFLFGKIETDILIGWCYALLGLATVAAIIFPILGMAKNPVGAKSALIGVVALGVVFVIAYALAGDEMIPKYEKFISGPGESKLVSMGLITFYILAAGAVLAIISSMFTKLIK